MILVSFYNSLQLHMWPGVATHWNLLSLCHACIHCQTAK